jgi:hypothetical protein
MKSDHPRNTGPMLSSQRCGARTRSGKLCRSPAVAGKKHCRMRGGAHWIRCSSRQQEPAQAWVLHPRGHCGTPAATRVAPAIVQAAPKDRVSENVARSSDGGHGLHREKVKGDRRAFIGSSYHRHGRPAAWSIDLSAGSGHRKRPLALGIAFRKAAAAWTATPPSGLDTQDHRPRLDFPAFHVPT